MLGKRKRDVTVVKRPLQTRSAIDEHTSQPQSDAREVFKHYFEAQFEPLTDLALSTSSLTESKADGDQQDRSDGESETSQWSGIVDAETASGAVEVTKHELVTESEDASIDSTEVKTFMVSYCPYRSLHESDLTAHSCRVRNLRLQGHYWLR